MIQTKRREITTLNQIISASLGACLTSFVGMININTHYLK